MDGVALRWEGPKKKGAAKEVYVVFRRIHKTVWSVCVCEKDQQERINKKDAVQGETFSEWNHE